MFTCMPYGPRLWVATPVIIIHVSTCIIPQKFRPHAQHAEHCPLKCRNTWPICRAGYVPCTLGASETLCTNAHLDRRHAIKPCACATVCVHGVNCSYSNLRFWACMSSAQTFMTPCSLQVRACMSSHSCSGWHRCNAQLCYCAASAEVRSAGYCDPESSAWISNLNLWLPLWGM